jgi:ESS family glutamate:Na+ symporter
MLAGACLQKALDAVGLGGYVDRRVMERIGSSVSDYLVAFGVASLKISVVVELAVPITVMSVFGIVFAMTLFWYIGRRIYHNFWFERSIFVYGWNTGVVAIGITLLRVVDPRLRTKTLEDFGLAYIFISVAEIIMLVTVPVLVVNGVILAPALVLIGGFIACIFLSRGMVGWFRQPAYQLREEEEDIIGKTHQGTGEER